jgi:hypothetical protein
MKFLYRNVYLRGETLWKGAVKHRSMADAKAGISDHSMWIGVETLSPSPDPRFRATVVFFTPARKL